MPANHSITNVLSHYYYHWPQRKDYLSTSTIIGVLKAQCKVRTEPKSGIPEPKPEPYLANLKAPIFLVHRAALPGCEVVAKALPGREVVMKA